MLAMLAAVMGCAILAYRLTGELGAAILAALGEPANSTGNILKAVAQIIVGPRSSARACCSASAGSTNAHARTTPSRE